MHVESPANILPRKCNCNTIAMIHSRDPPISILRNLGLRFTRCNSNVQSRTLCRSSNEGSSSRGRVMIALIFLIIKLIMERSSSRRIARFDLESASPLSRARSTRLALPRSREGGPRPLGCNQFRTVRRKPVEREEKSGKRRGAREERALARRRDLRTLGRSMARI